MVYHKERVHDLDEDDDTKVPIENAAQPLFDLLLFSLDNVLGLVDCRDVVRLITSRTTV